MSLSTTMKLLELHNKIDRHLVEHNRIVEERQSLIDDLKNLKSCIEMVNFDLSRVDGRQLCAKIDLALAKGGVK